MESVVYRRLKYLCARKGISIKQLERDLDFGNSSVKKWGRISSPSIDKIIKVANYFNVSIDYLLGRTDIEEPTDEILEDQDIISFQRARQKMTPNDRERMMTFLKAGFSYAFSDEEDK